MASSAIVVKQLGLADYSATFEAMKAFTAARTAETTDEIWLVEHPPVFTLGLAGKMEHLLQVSDIPLVKVDRGGQITYHGPGQVVAYLLLDLRRHGLLVRELVWKIEAATLQTLRDYVIAAERKEGAPGLYLDETAPKALQGAKIAALGLKIRQGCSYHGVSLNVAMDLSPFDLINPCGYEGLRTVDMATLGCTASWQNVANTLAARLIEFIEKPA
ncbi:lipoyl(octanoyl) transferase LipB [Ampullimonas aquatilis]|uniref:lipoyl(octanoyl) transferase LipB n=1 Tax=Ampullimonas aquatilis TaxID=1341549 RepID=UPI003C75CDD5